LTTVRRSLAYSIADNYLSVALQLISTVIIARLLTPTETGIFAVAAVFAAIASTFRDFGVAEYLIQEQELTNEKIRSALAANIMVSWFVGAALFIASDAISNFYRSPGIAEVMRIQAINFLFIPFGAVTMAYFRRQLDFRPIFIANTASNITSFVVAITCALMGLGYMSLAWSSLAGVIVVVSISLRFRPADFPRWPGMTQIRSVIHFGKHASGIYILGQAGRSAPEMIIGRALDMPAVAFFSRASGLVEIFNRLVLRPVTSICLPYFAKSRRDEGTVVTGYLQAVSYLTAVGWPFFLLLGITAYGAIRLIYGSQWIPSVPLAQILCIVALIEVTFFLAKDAIIAAGRIERSNLLQLGVQGSRIAGLLAVVPYGLSGAAWGLLAASLFGAAFSQRLLTQTIGLRSCDLFKACLPSVYIAAISTIPVAIWAVFDTPSEENYLHFLFAGGLMTALLWFVSVRHFLPSLWNEVVRIACRMKS
jgi:O-antigen/teichoic acid export membrane protein